MCSAGFRPLLSRIAASTPCFEVRESERCGDARVDLRMRLKEAPQPRHQPFRDQARRCRNDQHIALTRALELANGVAHGFQTGLQAGIDQASGLRQLDRARAPGEQRQAKLLLQPSDLVAERSRRHMQLFGGPREAHVARNGLEGTQRIQRQQRLPFR